MKSIKGKIGLLIAVICIVMGCALGFFSIYSANKTIGELSEEELIKLSEQAAETISASIDTQFAYLEGMASNKLVNSANANVLTRKKFLMQQAERLENVKDIGFADLEGTSLAADCTTLDHIAETSYFQEALNGARAVSDPMEDTADTGVMVIHFAVPVYDEEGTGVGVLFMTSDASFLSSITNQIKFGETEAAYMINDKGVCVASEDYTKVLTKENTIEDYAADASYQEMIASMTKVVGGGAGYTDYTLNGVRECIGYAEVPGADWHVLAGIPFDELYAGRRALQKGILLIAAAMIILASLVGLILASRLVKPIIAAKKELERIADGDLSVPIPKKLLKIKDETGSLARALDKMQSSLREAINGVNTQSESVISFANEQDTHVKALKANVENVSATTQELSASAEETAASTESMTTASAEAKSAVDNIAVRAQEGAKAAEEIGRRAKELENSSMESQRAATDMYQQSMTMLAQAIEDSRKVEEINKLSNAILSITSQTNLLALNASIEAARAGDAGRGFAVVATEIGKLAEDSQQSVNQIKSVTVDVISSVEHLSDCAQKILKFVDEIVMTDYEKMVESGRQYNEDAVKINEIVSDLSATTEELHAAITNIVTALNEVAAATEESASGTAHIAESSTAIADKTEKVAELAEGTISCTNKLAEAISVFRI